jgi:hypothetical protein
MFGRDQRAHQRADRAGKHLRLGSAGQFADLAGVLFRQRQRHIAGNRGDAQHVELGAGERQKDGNRVVLARVGIDDDLASAGHRHAPNLLELVVGADHIRCMWKNAIWVFHYPRRSLRT